MKKINIIFCVIFLLWGCEKNNIETELTTQKHNDNEISLNILSETDTTEVLEENLINNNKHNISSLNDDNINNLPNLSNFTYSIPTHFQDGIYENENFTISIKENTTQIESLEEIYKKAGYNLSATLGNFISNNQNITQDDLINLLSNNIPFVLLNCFSMTDLESSFEFVRFNNNNVGETCFQTSMDGCFFNPSFTYKIAFLSNSQINEIHINLTIKNENHYKENLGNYIYQQNNTWFWNDRNTISDFYNQLQIYDKTLPESILEFQRTIDYIKSTLLLNGENVSFVPENKSTIDTGIVNDDAVRLRTSPFLGEKSHVITLLSKNDKVTILDIGNYEEIDEYNAPWYKVKTENNQTGWIYGGYITR